MDRFTGTTNVCPAACRVIEPVLAPTVKPVVETSNWSVAGVVPEAVRRVSQGVVVVALQASGVADVRASAWRGTGAPAGEARLTLRGATSTEAIWNDQVAP